jgi:hypothetical protein
MVDVQVSGSLQAPSGKIEISSTERSVRMDQALAAAAQEVKISAAQNIKINAPLVITAQVTHLSAGKNVIVKAPVMTQGNTTD